MEETKVSVIKTKSRLKKIGERYFLPFEIWNYLDFGTMLFFIVIAFIIVPLNERLNYLFIGLIIFYLIKIVVAIKDRFFVEIKTSKSLTENVNLIKELAKRQPNFTQSLDEEGLFLFEYSERNIFYKYNYRKRDHVETVVIYCEDNSIWVSSYNLRYFGIFRRYNLKQWIKLIQLKSEN
ncbi:hypothetical protein [Empedobacter sedimenti]|uniref:hypothetical protein n=1 Tax=Empedobacter sedimenti TaxID=3042610 RepID=UPI0024A6A52A|nr:hypothetical protein [Empedobacter sedimenti]